MEDEQKLDRKAQRRAVASGAFTGAMIALFLFLIPMLNLRREEPLIVYFSGALCPLLFISALGG